MCNPKASRVLLDARDSFAEVQRSRFVVLVLVALGCVFKRSDSKGISSRLRARVFLQREDDADVSLRQRCACYCSICNSKASRRVLLDARDGFAEAQCNANHLLF